jgi:hypothetical protein
LKRLGQRGGKGERYYVYTYVPGFVKTDKTTQQDRVDDRETIFAAWLQRDQAQAAQGNQTGPSFLKQTALPRWKGFVMHTKSPIDRSRL